MIKNYSNQCQNPLFNVFQFKKTNRRLKKFLCAYPHNKVCIKRNINKNNHNLLFNKLVGLLIKGGKRNKAFKIASIALKITSKQTNLPIRTILTKLILKIKPSFETKELKVRHRTHLKPKGIKFKRQVFLALKWLLSSSKVRMENTSINLAIEIISILTDRHNNTVGLKYLNFKKATQNLSNKHFRW